MLIKAKHPGANRYLIVLMTQFILMYHLWWVLAFQFAQSWLWNKRLTTYFMTRNHTKHDDIIYPSVLLQITLFIFLFLLHNFCHFCKCCNKCPVCSSDHRIPDSKVHGADMEPTWVLSAPDGPHIGPMNLAIRDVSFYYSWLYPL